MTDYAPGLAPQPGFRRVACHCQCGVWFYWPRQAGRTRLYLNDEHAYRAKRARVASRMARYAAAEVSP